MADTLMTFGEKIIRDKNGNQKAVLIGMKQYKRILHLLGEVRTLKLIRAGEEEYASGKIKPIRSLMNLK